jgi:hypothetical protein
VKNRPRRLISIVLLPGSSMLAVWMPASVRSASTSILISAAYYDTYLTNEPDEAFRLMNISRTAIDLTSWAVTDGPSEGTVTLSGTLVPGASIWLAREAASFSLEFGFSPDVTAQAVSAGNCNGTLTKIKRRTNTFLVFMFHHDTTA